MTQGEESGDERYRADMCRSLDKRAKENKRWTDESAPIARACGSDSREFWRA